MPDAISYTLRFPNAQNHRFEVEARFPTGGKPEVELMLPVWSPGSYLVREYARNVEELRAATEGGAPLEAEKVAKNRWRVATLGNPWIVVRYGIYGRELSVRTNFVNQSFALVNGPATFLTLAGAENRPYRVTVVPPPGWARVVTPLELAPAPAGPSYEAADYDELVDSPLYLGNAEVLPFAVEGKEHRLVNDGGQGAWDGPRSAADLEKVVRTQAAFWGVVPYPRYVFFNLLTDTGGGLEHKGSTVLMASPFATRTHDAYVEWLGLASHELFHAWNVKRLRPRALGPFDYEHENYTHDLWVAEGFTDYYGDLMVRRAGLSTRKEYLKVLGDAIEALQTTPGRRTQRLADASFDAWIKYYRRDENSANSSVSYYTKGAVVAFLLDAHIRRLSGGKASLDDGLRLAYRRYAGEHGYRSEEFRRTLSEAAGSDLSGWLALAVDSTEELDFTEALDWYGLHLVEGGDKKGEKDEESKGGEPKEKAAWLGAETENDKGQLVVTEVRRDTPAFAAGLNVGDEILALGEFRVPPDGLGDRLKAYRPGDREELLVARRGRLLRLPVVLGEKPKPRWHLEVSPQASAEQKARLEAWLGAEKAGPDSEVQPPAGAALHR
jgi:predicted metalloprotease with PDZ domain